MPPLQPKHSVRESFPAWHEQPWDELMASSSVQISPPQRDLPAADGFGIIRTALRVHLRNAALFSHPQQGHGKLTLPSSNVAGMI